MGCLELSADMQGTCGKTYCRVCSLANTCMSFKSILNGKSKSGLKKKVGAVTTIASPSLGEANKIQFDGCELPDKKRQFIA